MDAEPFTTEGSLTQPLTDWKLTEKGYQTMRSIKLSCRREGLLLLLQLKIEQDRQTAALLLSDFVQKDRALQIIADQVRESGQTAADVGTDIPAEGQAAGPDQIGNTRSTWIRDTGPSRAGRLLLRMMARWRPARAVWGAGACL